MYLLSTANGFAQQVTKPNYYQHIQPIINQHCVSCHRPNGDAPFSLTSYAEVVQRATMIVQVTNSRYMPPFPANTDYRSYANQNCLTHEEIELLKSWIANNTPEGKRLPVKKSGKKNKYSKRKNSRAEVQNSQTVSLPLPSALTIPSNNTDRFERILLQNSSNSDVWVSGFQFNKTNNKAVHHTELMICRPNECPPFLDDYRNKIGDATTYESKIATGNFSYLSGWLPGQNAEFGEFFPKGFAKFIPAGSGFMYLIHYAPSPIEQRDSGSIVFYSDKNLNPRPVESIDLHGTQLFTKGQFNIPPNQTVTLHSTKVIAQDFSIFSIMPHAHHLAKQMLAYCITPNNDTIPLLKINHWRFAWQLQYKLPKLLRLEKGSIIHFFVTYDNTDQNPENPNTPPKKVGYSFNANDEMMELFLLGSPYQDGDETLILNW